MQITLCTDAAACLGIGQRLGVGRIKHLEMKTLWLQLRIKAGDVKIEKISTNDIEADIGTKASTKEKLAEVLPRLNVFKLGVEKLTMVAAVSESLESYERGGASVSRRNRVQGVRSPSQNDLSESDLLRAFQIIRNWLM